VWLLVQLFLTVKENAESASKQLNATSKDVEVESAKFDRFAEIESKRLAFFDSEGDCGIEDPVECFAKTNIFDIAMVTMSKSGVSVRWFHAQGVCYHLQHLGNKVEPNDRKWRVEIDGD
jgi:hypothetical protein